MKGSDERLSHTARTKNFSKPMLPFGNNHITIATGEHMFEKKFLEAVAERALKTFVQTLLALIGTDSIGILNVDILAAAQVAGSAALLSVLTSFASSKVGDKTPSLAKENTLEALAEKVVPVLAAEAIKAVENSTKRPVAKATAKSNTKAKTPKKSTN